MVSLCSALHNWTLILRVVVNIISWLPCCRRIFIMGLFPVRKDESANTIISLLPDLVINLPKRVIAHYFKIKSQLIVSILLMVSSPHRVKLLWKDMTYSRSKVVHDGNHSYYTGDETFP